MRRNPDLTVASAVQADGTIGEGGVDIDGGGGDGGCTARPAVVGTG